MAATTRPVYESFEPKHGGGGLRHHHLNSKGDDNASLPSRRPVSFPDTWWFKAEMAEFQPKAPQYRADLSEGMSQELLKFEAAALHWSCYTTGDETEVQASQ